MGQSDTLELYIDTASDVINQAEAMGMDPFTLWMFIGQECEERRALSDPNLTMQVEAIMRKAQHGAH